MLCQSSTPIPTNNQKPNDLVPLAIIYDFDGTLCPGYMQDQFIRDEIGKILGPKLQIKPNEYLARFWDEVKKLTKDEQADEILVYLHYMLIKAEEAEIPVRRDDFLERGKNVKLFAGVKEWFDRVDKFGLCFGVKVKHYIVSSGNTEIIQGTPIASKFEQVYACKFLFDKQHGIAKRPIQAVNFTTKTQFLFRINKGIHDVSDTAALNEFVPLSEREIPFPNMIYIGDTEKDIPCMRLIKELGGLSLAVFDPERGPFQATELYKQGRVHGVTPADYTAGKELDQVIQNQIRQVAAHAVMAQRARSIQLSTALDSSTGMTAYTEDKHGCLYMFMCHVQSWYVRHGLSPMNHLEAIEGTIPDGLQQIADGWEFESVSDRDGCEFEFVKFDSIQSEVSQFIVSWKDQLAGGNLNLLTDFQALLKTVVAKQAYHSGNGRRHTVYLVKNPPSTGVINLPID